MAILVDTRWIGSHGIGRFASEVIKRLGHVQALKDGLSPVNPLDPIWCSWKIAQTEPKPQVYFSPGYTPPMRCPVPFVFVIHDLNHLDVGSNASALKRAYYRYIIYPACLKAFRVLTVSEFSRQQIIQWSGLTSDRVVNVSNGVGINFQPEGSVYRPGYPYLLHVGNHKPHKNIARILEAFMRSGMSSRFKLLLSGNRDRDTMKLIHKWHIESSVVFVGKIHDKDLPALYRGAKALLLPSLYEGFGLPIVEAMACGTPVLTSNITSLPEVAGNAALLIDPYNVDEMVTGIRILVNTDSVCQRLKEKGLIQSKKFTWDRTAENVKNILRQAIDKG